MCDGKTSSFQNAKGKLSNDKNPFSFPMTYFYNRHKLIQVQFHSHFPPPNPNCFHQTPSAPSWRIFLSLTCYIIIFLQSCIQLVISFHRIFHHCCHKMNLAPHDSWFLPRLFLFYGELLLFTHSNYCIHDMLLDTYSPSKNIPLLIISNLGLSHDMCKEFGVKSWNVFTKKYHFIFSILLFLWPNLICKWQTKVLLGLISPLL